jgi:hypothetical protein
MLQIPFQNGIVFFCSFVKEISDYCGEKSCNNRASKDLFKKFGHDFSFLELIPKITMKICKISQVFYGKTKAGNTIFFRKILPIIRKNKI